MPVFEYKCDDCGKITEFLQSSARTVEKTCPHCGGKLKKVFSTFALGVKKGDSKRCLTCSDRTCPHSQ